MTLNELIAALERLRDRHDCGSDEVRVVARTDLEGGIWCEIDSTDDIYMDEDGTVVIAADEV